MSLAPPPRFGGPKAPEPQTVEEWLQFWRWLFAQWRVVVQLENATLQPNSFPVIPQREPSAAPLAFQPFPPRVPDLGEVLGLVSSVQRVPSPGIDRIAALAGVQPGGFPFAPYVTRRTIEITVCTQATFPTLTTGSIALFIYVTDYVHWIYWDGTVAAFADGGNRGLTLFEVNPGTGWALYDGSTVAALNADGTTTNVVLPDLTSAANLAAFLKAGGTNSGPTAAIAPGITGTSASGTAVIAASATTTNSAAIAGSTGNDTTATQTVAAGVGATVPGEPHVHSIGTIADSGHAHVVTPVDTGHTHGVGSYVVDATGEGRKLVRRPYFRR